MSVPEPEMRRITIHDSQPDARRSNQENLGKIREAIYDLAITGEDFSAYDVLEMTKLPRSTFPVVSNSLKAAALVGILEKKGRQSVHRPQSKEDWLAGKPVQKDSVFFYCGAPSVRRHKEVR